MHMKVTHGALAAAVKSIAGAVPRENMSPWRHVRIDADGKHVTLTACDGDMQIERRINADVEEPGVVLVAGKQFVPFASALPEGVCEICTHGMSRVKIVSGASQFDVGAVGVEEWPVFSGPGEKSTAVYMPAITLREMIRKTAWSMSKDPTRSNLRCVHAELVDGKLTMVATDGRSLGMIEHELGVDGKADVSFPEKLVGVLQSLLGSEGDARLEFDRRAIRVTSADWSVTSRAVEDVYPLWRRVIPEKLLFSTVADRKLFLDETTRAALSSSESYGIGVAFTGKGIDFSAKCELSRYSSRIDVKSASEDAVRFMVDHRILKAALGCLDADEVTFCYAAANAQIVVKTEIPWLAVVMPLREA